MRRHDVTENKLIAARFNLAGLPLRNWKRP